MGAKWRKKKTRFIYHHLLSFLPPLLKQPLVILVSAAIWKKNRSWASPSVFCRTVPEQIGTTVHKVCWKDAITLAPLPMCWVRQKEGCILLLIFMADLEKKEKFTSKRSLCEREGETARDGWEWVTQGGGVRWTEFWQCQLFYYMNGGGGGGVGDRRTGVVRGIRKGAELWGPWCS